MLSGMGQDLFEGIDFGALPPPEPFTFDVQKAVFAERGDERRMQLQIVALARLSPAKFRHAMSEVAEIVHDPLSAWRFRKHVDWVWKGFVKHVFKRALEAGHPEACGMSALIAIAELAKQNEEARVKQERRRAAGRKAAQTRAARELARRRIG